MSEENRSHLEYLFDVIGKAMNLTKGEIIIPTRKRQQVLARKLLAHYLRKGTTLSLREIGAIIGKDHATVVHYHKSISELGDTSPYVNALMYSIDTGMVHPALNLRGKLSDLIKYKSSNDNRVDDVYDFLFKNMDSFSPEYQSYNNHSFQDQAIQLQKAEIIELKQSVENMKSIIREAIA